MMKIQQPSRLLDVNMCVSLYGCFSLITLGCGVQKNGPIGDAN